MTAIEKQQLKQLQTAVTNLAIEMTELKKLLRRDDADVVVKVEEGIITLYEIEATVKVLKNYKQQGFKTVEL